ncbi:outer membrane protein Omp38 [Alkanindiges illinoisensis]|uniref:outer membrane protein Omp38 n=1 Tax=Alkanindiges illinoisensis TaxID=197183 RepID=UPI00047B1E39|nr:OmpA family protein [Alkanindiges illinoisensis]
MQLSRAVLAMLMAIPFTAATAGVTVSPLILGYTWYPDNAKKRERTEQFNVNQASTGYQLDNDVYTGAAIGLELTPGLGFEVEYGETHADAKLKNGTTSLTTDTYDAKQKNLLGNFYVTSDLITKNYDSKVKPYMMLGGGQAKYEIDDTAGNVGTESTDTIGNAGLGVFWRVNDSLSIRTEGRAIYNFDNKIWEPQAIAGLNLVLGGHLKPAVPIAPVEPVAPPPPVVVPAPTPIPAPLPPKELTEDLRMELRIFFDTNKSVIKAQYKPEVAKVATKLQEYPNAAATIEGHTDNTGSRQLNERLALARANAVKSMLVNEFGINSSRLTTQGFAWDSPIATNATPDGRALNRRVYAVIKGSRTVIIPADQVPAN